MLDEKDLQAIAQLMKPIQEDLAALKKDILDVKTNGLTTDEKISNIESKISHMQEDITDIKENAEVTRNSVNMLLDWADDKSIQPHPILDKKAN